MKSLVYNDLKRNKNVEGYTFGYPQADHTVICLNFRVWREKIAKI